MLNRARGTTLSPDDYPESRLAELGLDDVPLTGTVWELTATGESSGRTVTFTFTGG